MQVMLARLVFLAFLGLCGGIVYNALYLQDLRGLAGKSPPAPRLETRAPQVSAPQASASIEVKPLEAKPRAAKLPPVITDLPSLKPGDGGSLLLVRAVQRELATRGHDIGEADGKLTGKTRAAIAAYEQSEGLPVTGLASDDLLHHILLGTNVKPEAAGSAAATGAGSSGNQSDTVKAIQQILADLGYAPGAIDGAIGAATAEAISAFQRDRNVAVTGDISPDLLSELKRVTGRDLTKTAAKP
ncbi:MAG: peptidoglycan-binding domain-containing protein [Methyloceanibacter sp.]